MNFKRLGKKYMINDILNLNNIQGECENDNAYDKAFGTSYKASGNIFVARRTYQTSPLKFEGSTRSCISGFSDGAGRRMRKYLRECMAVYKEMVTLTYPFSYSIDGSEIKEHLRRFLQEMRREWVRHANECCYNVQEYSAFWFLEFQERGAPHFHIFATWCPSRVWVAETWYRIVNSEDERHLRAGTRVEYLRLGKAGTIAYASKYAAKMEQKTVPDNYINCGRFWGVSGRRGVMSAATFVRASQLQKSDVREGLTRMIRLLNYHLFTGTIECLFKDDETRVFIVHDDNVMRKIRIWVSRLSSMVHDKNNIFYDAELS